MQIRPGLDLTYCTNIHAGESWDEVEASVMEYAVALKQRLAPEASFGIGLRLSAAAASQLLTGSRLATFKQFLDRNHLYVALINGFPFGSFHGEVVKAKVFAPDWRARARVQYTLELAEILSVLLPEGIDGGISTLPLSYKPWVGDTGEVWPAILIHLTEVTAGLAAIRERTGRLIHLDIEPEPQGLLESTPEFIMFFNGPLLHFCGPMLAERMSCTVEEAQARLRDHIQICFDSCHMAVQFEDAAASLRLLAEHGIGVGRVQISSALRIAFESAPEEKEHLRKRLAPFTGEGIYLHQVVERGADGALRHYTDLEEALASESPNAQGAAEWRIHFHVPLFIDNHGNAFSTQNENRAVLALAAQQDISPHLEIETYTWHVLPAALKTDLLSSVEREFQWVLAELNAGS